MTSNQDLGCWFSLSNTYSCIEQFSGRFLPRIWMNETRNKTRVSEIIGGFLNEKSIHRTNQWINPKSKIWLMRWVYWAIWRSANAQYLKQGQFYATRYLYEKCFTGSLKSNFMIFKALLCYSVHIFSVVSSSLERPVFCSLGAYQRIGRYNRPKPKLRDGFSAVPFHPHPIKNHRFFVDVRLGKFIKATRGRWNVGLVLEKKL